MSVSKGDTHKQLSISIRLDKKILFAVLVTAMMVISTTHVVLAATEDSVIITFDPDGDIDIDVSLANYSFGSVISGLWTNTTGGTFTLFNNGTVSMNTQIKSNATTDEGNMTLDIDGNPPMDNYSFYTIGFDNDDYITTAYGVNFDLSLSASDSKTFDLGLNLGNLSANHTVQTTTIYFQGNQV